MKNDFLKAMGAGFLIGIAALMYATIANNILGALLFSFGLIAILTLQLNLFTGKIGSFYFNKNTIKILLITLLGNFIGAFGLGILLSYAGCYSATTIATAKISKTLIRTAIDAMLCGAMMETAVNCFKKSQNPIIVILCIAVFILSGFEHCIADMFFFGLARMFPIQHIITQILGNSLGAIIIHQFEVF